MNQETKKWFTITGILLIAFAVFTILIMKVDVQAVGPEGSVVGFATINKAFAGAVGYSDTFYKISKYAGYLTYPVLGAFALYGLLMLIVRKSFAKVDRDLYVLGGFYVFVLIVKICFDKFVVNYRPVILDEGLEPSYPSSHTIMAICFMVTAMLQFDARIKSKRLYIALQTACALIMLIIVASRLLSGVHWLTDILGAILLSACLIALYIAVVKLVEPKKKRQHE